MLTPKDYCYSIYQHTFPNGKIYIGITSQYPEHRWANGKGYSKQPLMKNAIDKYGWDVVQHDILTFGLTKEEAEHFERLLILEKQANNRTIGYNCENGGTTAGKCSPEGIENHRIASTGRRHSEETKRILHEKAIGRPSAFKGCCHSEETKRRLSEIHTGMTHCDAVRQKMSLHRRGENNPMFGKQHSEQTRVLIREAQRKRFKPVKCVETGIVYETQKDASIAFGVAYSTIKNVCDKVNKTVKGFHIVSVEVQ